MEKLKIQSTEPVRIDIAATENLKISRSQIAKAIKAGLILVDGKKVKAGELVSSKSDITYDPSFLVPKEKSKKLPPKLKILYEDDSVLVVDKPAGLLVHETKTVSGPTLVDAILAYDPLIKNVGDDAERPGIVHRLDKDASGVMIVAKTQKAFEHLKAQFQNRLVEKHYTALVHGAVEDPAGTIDFPIARSKSHGARMAARPTSQEGREAVTHFDVTKRFNHFTLLDVQIETGRTHQIRVHMFATEHPIVGDPVYRQKGIKPAKINRMFLHASKLTIELPGGEKKTFKSLLPKELKEFMKKI